jgi:hypothetical protein
MTNKDILGYREPRFMRQARNQTGKEHEVIVVETKTQKSDLQISKVRKPRNKLMNQQIFKTYIFYQCNYFIMYMYIII